MYNLLLVDDERIIREGIAQLVDWQSLGIVFAGSAKDGFEAYEMIIRDRPDIMITDIKMPGMDGLELIKRLRAEFIDIDIIVLSGFGEFEMAREAMQHGVKHYLLKPCNENKIMDVLEKVTLELTQKKEKEEFQKDTRRKLEKVIPQVKEQFLRDFALTRLYSKNECGFYQELFNIKENSFCMVLMKIEKQFDNVIAFALKNIAEEIIEQESVYLSTVIKESLLLLIYPIDFNKLAAMLKKIKEAFLYYFNAELTIAISGEYPFEDIPLMYQEACECLEYKFYVGEGSIITREDVNFSRISDEGAMDMDFSRIAMSIRNGNIEDIKSELDKIFSAFISEKYEADIIKTYCIDLYLTIIRQCKNEKINEYIKMIVEIYELDTTENIRRFIEKVACEIAGINYESNCKRHSAVVNNVIQCIHDNYADENLSLIMIAEKMLYMNVDYLGKLFKKELKIKFSQYVLNVRMEKAKELLAADENQLTCDLARKTGFGDNPRYFNQVFKKYTGMTPTEYKKTL